MLCSVVDVQQGPVYYDTRSHILTTLAYALIPICAITILILVSMWMWKRHKNAYHQALPTCDPSPATPPSPLLGYSPLQLLEVKARGRYGCVWRAQMKSRIVAVKIFPLQDKQSWATERDIYLLPQMGTCNNILQYLGAEKRGDNLNTELWLITEFHERGSLYDYLKVLSYVVTAANI
ncbi:hypothetical protein NP493_295g10008 [Ridgeia piscesae]|uniref:receptor protein serine/threonine kinase n=1 Tax=Ridgeia piscesae TaxID=27915 RepID=A0AAD9NWM7_RIDPI|nr:hypothetical protein NP493_295g10008 [Ridgeia piscesae]